MHSDEIAISVRNLTKKYRIFSHPGDRIKQALIFGRMRFHREIHCIAGFLLRDQKRRNRRHHQAQWIG